MGEYWWKHFMQKFWQGNIDKQYLRLLVLADWNLIITKDLWQIASKLCYVPLT